MYIETGAGKRKLAARLRRVLLDIPKAQAGSGTQSSSMTGFISYAHDMATFTSRAAVVLQSLQAAQPSAGALMWGAGVDAEEMRDAGRQAMDWLEAWVRWRGENSWQMCAPFGPDDRGPWEK